MADLPNQAGALRGAVEMRLREAGSREAALETRLLLAHFAGLSRLDLVSRPDFLVSDDRLQALAVALERRLKGEPVHRIIGHRQFYGLDLALSAETLEPRPDTEILVDTILPYVNRCVESQDACSVLDVGTGTGAICLAILSQNPVVKGVGIDISQDALATAARNSVTLGLNERFGTLHSDWFEKADGKFDIIVSNPPYIPSANIDDLEPEVRRFDPLRALDGGADGLVFYRKIATQAADHLNRGGVVGVEIGYDQRESVTLLFEEAGWKCLEAVQDLKGHQRVLIFMQS